MHKIYVVTRLIVFLVILLCVKAVLNEDLDGIIHCCDQNSINYTIDDIAHEHFCEDIEGNKEKFNIDCHGLQILVVELDSLNEVRMQENYCYVDHDNDTIGTAICHDPDEDKISISIHLLPISFVFLVLTFIIYYKIKTLRAPEDIAFMISVLCLAVFIFIQVPHYWFAHIQTLHNTFAFLDLFIAQFAIVGYFSWLNVIMANQLRKNMYVKIHITSYSFT